MKQNSLSCQESLSRGATLGRCHCFVFCRPKSRRRLIRDQRASGRRFSLSVAALDASSYFLVPASLSLAAAAAVSYEKPASADPFLLTSSFLALTAAAAPRPTKSRAKRALFGVIEPILINKCVSALNN